MLGLFLPLPVLALYARSLPDYTPQMLGLAMGAYGLTQAVFQIPFGSWSDRIGRKPLITWGLGMFAIGSLVGALAHTVTMLAVARSIQGAGAVSAAVTALLADLTRPEVRTRSMAVIGISIGLPRRRLSWRRCSTYFGVPGIF
jgi:MFS family permease